MTKHNEHYRNSSEISQSNLRQMTQHFTLAHRFKTSPSPTPEEAFTAYIQSVRQFGTCQNIHTFYTQQHNRQLELKKQRYPNWLNKLFLWMLYLSEKGQFYELTDKQTQADGTVILTYRIISRNNRGGTKRRRIVHMKNEQGWKVDDISSVHGIKLK